MPRNHKIVLLVLGLLLSHTLAFLAGIGLIYAWAMSLE